MTSQTPVTSFNRNIAHTLEKEVLDALQGVAAKYNLTVRSAGGNFTLTELLQKLSWSVSDPAALETQERSDFRILAPLYGLTPDAYGKTFTASSGKEYALIGFETKRRTYPFRCRAVKDGEVRLFGEAAIKTLK